MRAIFIIKLDVHTCCGRCGKCESVRKVDIDGNWSRLNVLLQAWKLAKFTKSYLKFMLYMSNFTIWSLLTAWSVGGQWWKVILRRMRRETLPFGDERLNARAKLTNPCAFGDKFFTLSSQKKSHQNWKIFKLIALQPTRNLMMLKSIITSMNVCLNKRPWPDQRTIFADKGVQWRLSSIYIKTCLIVMIFYYTILENVNSDPQKNACCALWGRMKVERPKEGKMTVGKC